MIQTFNRFPFPQIRRALESIVDFELNYGRESIREFAVMAGSVGTVLDVGAGSGRDLSTCRQIHPGSRLYAVECLPANIARLNDLSVSAFEVDVERNPLPLPDASVDLVIANQVLEHVKEIFWILHEVTRVLPVGGHFVVGVPNLASLHNRIILLLGMQPTPINSFSAHVRGFTKHDFLRLLDSCWPNGFRLVAHRGGNFYPFPPALARPLARALPSMAWGMFLLLRKERDYAGEFLSAPRAQQFETNFFLGDEA